MNVNIVNWTERVKKQYQPNTGRVLDIGSLNVNGSTKHLFMDATEYTGIDFRDGKDVDMVMNAHNTLQYFGRDAFDTIICMDMLEHDDAFWVTLDNIRAMLKQGGYLWVIMPTLNFPIHNHPGDYWRATEQAFRDVIFNGYKLLNMEKIYTKELNNKPINPVLCALGQKY